MSDNMGFQLGTGPESEAERLARASFATRFRALFTFTRVLMLLLFAGLGAETYWVLNLNLPEPERYTVDGPRYRAALEQLQASQGLVAELTSQINAVPTVPEELKALAQNADRSVADAYKAVKTLPLVEGEVRSLGLSPISAAYAAEDDQAHVTESEAPFRRTIAMGVLSAIFIFWVGCIVAYFFTRDPEKIKFSMTMMQTILGFYIGVFTGLMGLQAP
jgi:hypothetical protein